MNDAFANTNAANILNVITCSINDSNFHTRCACHIFNLAVKYRINLFFDSCAKIQYACDYIIRTNKAQRIHEFKIDMHMLTFQLEKIQRIFVLGKILLMKC